MKKYFYFLMLLLLPALLYSSNNKIKFNAENKDSIEATKVVFNFLHWYRYSAIPTKFINNFWLEDSTKIYSVDFDNVEVYLNVFKNTGFISSKYINYWRTYFKNIDKALKEKPQYDGMVDGLDFDLIMQTQDYSNEDFDRATIKNFESRGGTAIIEVDFTNSYILRYRLSKEKDKWRIDKIENEWND